MVEIGGTTIEDIVKGSDKFWNQKDNETKVKLIVLGAARTKGNLEEMKRFLDTEGIRAAEVFGQMDFLNEVAVEAVLRGREMIKSGKYVSYSQLLDENAVGEINERLLGLVGDEDRYRGTISGLLNLVNAITASDAERALKELEMEAIATCKSGGPVIWITGGTYFSDPDQKMNRGKSIVEPEAYLGTVTTDAGMTKWVEDAREMYKLNHPKTRKIDEWGVMVMNFWAGWGTAAAVPATGQSLDDRGIVMYENLIKTQKQTEKSFRLFGKPMPVDWEKYAKLLYLHHEFEHNWYPNIKIICNRTIFKEVEADLIAVGSVIGLVEGKGKGYEDFDLEEALICMWAEYNQYASQKWEGAENNDAYILSGRVILRLMEESRILADLSQVDNFKNILRREYETLMTNPNAILRKEKYCTVRTRGGGE